MRAHLEYVGSRNADGHVDGFGSFLNLGCWCFLVHAKYHVYDNIFSRTAGLVKSISVSYHAFLNVPDFSPSQDFSEDTYRTLAAADNAVMLVDAAKGLEPQTRKLFEVRNMTARQRIVTCY